MSTEASRQERAARPAAGPVLTAENLNVGYTVRGADRTAVRDVSFQIGPRESFGLVGESGCGKTTIALAVARYLPRNGRVRSGSITVAGQDVTALDRDALRRLRARTVSMVYQEPGRALNPSLRVGRQLAEVFELTGLSRREAYGRAEEMLRTVRISDTGRVLRSYPHQLSGGMLQRVIIAMALAARPSLLILDEPTTALDATVEAEILDLVSALRESSDTAVLFISHNLAVVGKMCDRVGVMYAGELVEEGPAAEVFARPRHPYTVGLLRSIPGDGRRRRHGRLDTIPGFLQAPGETAGGCVFAARCGLADRRCHEETPPPHPVGDGRTARCHHHERAADLPRTTPEDVPSPPRDRAAAPILSLRGVSKTFVSHGARVRALTGIDLDLRPGETLGLVGESGSGKTTLARVLLGLTPPDPGSSIELAGSPLAPTVAKRSGDQLRALQLVFQNPDSALNRRHTVRRLIGRALTRLAGLTGREREAALHELADAVRMEPRHLDLRPAQLSGGLKQRTAIARAFAGRPRVLVCDEPTSALDVSVQASILNLLGDLQGRDQVAYLFISHDLGVVRYLADRIAVLYLGRLMEHGDADLVLSAPQHPYTEALLSAMPRLGGAPGGRIVLEGEIPGPAHPPPGCVFHTRCPRRLASGVCETEEPPLAEVEPGHFLRCHIPVTELRSMQSAETL